jgi:ion channel
MEADIQFRRWKRWQLKYDLKNGKIDRLQWITRNTSSVVYELLTGFGYRPSRFIITTLLTFSIISFVNMAVLPGSLKQDGAVIKSITVPDAIFYTYSMLTALGFSTIVPDTGLAKLIAVSEALVGIGWLGLFTSLLVKRLIR